MPGGSRITGSAVTVVGLERRRVWKPWSRREGGRRVARDGKHGIRKQRDEMRRSVRGKNPKREGKGRRSGRCADEAVRLGAKGRTPRRVMDGQLAFEGRARRGFRNAQQHRRGLEGAAGDFRRDRVGAGSVGGGKSTSPRGRGSRIATCAHTPAPKCTKSASRGLPGDTEPRPTHG